MLHQIRDIEFSGATYQIEVYDKEKKESFWTFFQFDEDIEEENQALLKDAFCACGEEDPCSHIRAAEKVIYRKLIPLHLRFQHSFWNVLCKAMGAPLLYDFSKIHKEGKNSYSFKNGIFFSIQVQESGWIEQRKKENPENSIKFSSLSEEELRKWKEGRASPQLLYELSFFSDLAKKLFMLQENQKRYEISFTEDEEAIPTYVKVAFEEIRLQFKMSKEDLIALIPTFKTVDSPLKILMEDEEKIQKITYDEVKKAFHIQHSSHIHEPLPKERISLDSYWYISQKGFIPKKEESLFTLNEIPESKVGAFLQHYKERLAPLLVGTKIHSETKKFSYTLHFDKRYNLHISAYLLEKNDLSHPRTTFFEGYVYLPEKGFFPLSEPLQGGVERVIYRKDISSFVNHHRHFLNTIPGFTTHLASLPIVPTFNLTRNKTLLFSSKLEVEEKKAQDFGEWIYYPGEGFFTKIPSRLQQLFPEGLEVPFEEIASFIRKFSSELELIPHFFLKESPLTYRGIRVEVVSDTTLRVKPDFAPLQPTPLFFEEFVYIPQKGFFELPLTMRLPEKFMKETLISGEKLLPFLQEELPKLKNCITYLDPKLEVAEEKKFLLHSLEKAAQGGMVADISFVSEKGILSVAEIMEAWEKKRKVLFSQAGLLYLQEEHFDWLRNLTQNAEKKLQLTSLEFLKADAALSFSLPAECESFLPQLQELRSFSTPTLPPLEGFNSYLRLYQQKGLEWLYFLYKNGLSGLLCDDMGLGKTHQAMALMAAILNQQEKKTDPATPLFLIISPTSVIYHWQEKLASFFPTLPVHLFHGIRRNKKLPTSGVILTSYGVLRVEKERIKKLNFELVILDEIQVAKNPRSKVHEAIKQIQAQMRLGLTGTPIENNLTELKALFDLVLPGLMPSEKRFKEIFLVPIERAGDAKKKEMLQKLVHPFILRRKKKEVLEELPEKSVDKALCDLSAEQVELYHKVLMDRKSALQQDLSDTTAPIPYMHIFSLLSSLKMICNHPALFLKEAENYKKHSSGKWDLFTELLQEALDSEQKVVVFSQYLHMLDIMGAYLKEKKIGFAEIRGMTQKRGEELVRFREDLECKVFLGSLQAAGLGIDLTAASVVILYDRWWNAAREEQAIDRVHRMGQKWNVLVFKLISKGTLEEKIDLMIERKGRLLEEIVRTDDQATLKTLTREELMELLSF